MPVDDGCQSEFDAYFAANFGTFAVRCALARAARDDWWEAKDQAREDCRAEMGILDTIEDLFGSDALVHCVEATASVLEAFEIALDLEADCDIALEELDALIDEFEACRHAL